MTSMDGEAPTALLADDEPHLARALGETLQTLWPELRIVHVATNGVEAARRIAELQPDIAFLDIRMPGLDGLEVARGIEGATQVVFVTAYDRYAVEAFDHEALDYVVKPVTAERLTRCIDRLRRALGQPASEDARLLTALDRLQPGAGAVREPIRWVRASSGELTHQIAVEEVLYFHADEKYTCVRTQQAEHVIRTSIQELAQQLDPRQFVQVHRATIVNLAHLAGTRRDASSRLFVRFKGLPRELPVSRAYVHRFKAM